MLIFLPNDGKDNGSDSKLLRLSMTYFVILLEYGKEIEDSAVGSVPALQSRRTKVVGSTPATGNAEMRRPISRPLGW